MWTDINLTVKISPSILDEYTYWTRIFLLSISRQVFTPCLSLFCLHLLHRHIMWRGVIHCSTYQEDKQIGAAVAQVVGQLFQRVCGSIPSPCHMHCWVRYWTPNFSPGNVCWLPLIFFCISPQTTEVEHVGTCKIFQCNFLLFLDYITHTLSCGSE